MNKLIFVLLCFFTKVQAQDSPFITKWKFEEKSEITLKIPQGHTIKDYDMIIDWGDGTKPDHNKLIHTYTKPGTYFVKVSGRYPGIRLGIDMGLEYKEQNGFLTVVQWGDNQWLSMEGMFSYCTNFKTIEAKDKPNLSKLTDMSGMFLFASNFNEPLNDWDVSNVSNMSQIFQDAEKFDQPLDKWNVSNVTNMTYVFRRSPFNQPLNNWNVSNVTNMKGMFEGAEKFNQPLNNWNVSKVTDMREMFWSAKRFNQPLNSWDVSKVTDMYEMFWTAKKFNQPLNNWDVSKVKDMTRMFYRAQNFNQPLEKWNVKKVKKYESFRPITSCSKLPKKFRNSNNCF